MKCKNVNGNGKFFAALCMLCILLLTFPTALTVNAKSNAKLTASAVTAERGNTVSVTFTLEGNPGLWGLKCKVGYDHSALTLKSVTNGNIFEDNDIVLPGSLDREQFVFAAAANKLEDNTADGTMVTLRFLVEDGAAAQNYPVTLEVTQAINLAGEDVGIRTENGSVTVTAPETPGNPPEDLGEDHTGTELKTGSAKTGDDSNPFLWAALLLIVLSGGGTYCALRVRTGR